MINEELKRFIDIHIAEDRNTDKITVFPLRCGLGKSTYIKYKLAETILKGDSLIIITDSIDGLNDYVSGEDKLAEYIHKNKSKFTILNTTNRKEELKTLHLKKIVLLSTQWYFDLTVDEIKTLLTKTRNTIIFDEKPIFYDIRKIGTKQINDIATAFKEDITNKANQKDKRWLIEQWEIFRQRIQAIMNEYENESQKEVNSKWHFLPILKITNNDSKFLELVKRFKTDFDRHNKDTYKNIMAVINLIADGARFTSKKIAKGKRHDKTYENYFSVYIDNSDKLLNVDAKIFVLDGTADISPEYNVDYIDWVNCSDFSVAPNNLTINCVNVNTNRDKMYNPIDRSYIKCIADYIKTIPDNDNIVFTYLKCENEFRKYGFTVEHFNHIKGTNKFRDKTNIVQVGLNRFDNLTYEIITGFNALFTSNYNHKNKKVIKELGKNAFDAVSYNFILQDIEQNLFRSKIRNVNCTDKVTYTVLFNTKYHYKLVEMMQKRYGKDNIHLIDTPSNIRNYKKLNRKAKNKTAYQKFVEWHNKQTINRMIDVETLKSDMDVTKDQFKKLSALQDFKEKVVKNKNGLYLIKV